MQITIESSKFTIKSLPARQAMHLARDVISLLVDTNTIKAVVFKQLAENILGSGVLVDGVSDEELQRIAIFDEATLLSNLIQSAISGLNESALDSLIDRCLCNVTYHNGIMEINALEALNSDMIGDWMTIVELIKHVVTLNFNGAINRIKKLLNLNSSLEKTVS